MKLLTEKTADYSVGDVFYYRIKKVTYGAVFLFCQENNYLFAVSEKLTDETKESVQSVLNAPLYTLAWFSDVDLPSKRKLHYLGKVTVTGDFTNRAGLLAEENGSVYNNNAGQTKTLKHEYRSFALPGMTVKDVLNTRYVPLTHKYV